MEPRIDSTGSGRRGQAGYSYVEILLATLLVALLLGPAIDALSVGVRGAEVHRELAEGHVHLTSLLEETLARPFDDLDAEALAVGDPATASAFSDTAGSPRRRLVFLSRYDADDADGDGDRFTGGEDGLLWVRVQLEHSDRGVETLTAR